MALKTYRHKGSGETVRANPDSVAGRDLEGRKTWEAMSEEKAGKDAKASGSGSSRQAPARRQGSGDTPPPSE